MSRQPTDVIARKHRPAFEAWHAAGRLVTPDVLDAAKVARRQTVYEWIAAEGWELVADDIDEAQVAAMVDGQRERTAAAEKAKLGFIERGEALIHLAQELTSNCMLEITGRYRRGCAVDVGEVKDAVSAVKTVTDAGVQLYGLNKVAVNHSGKVDFETNLETIAGRLSKAGILPPELANAVISDTTANA